jgi:hypothetical protein
MSPKVQLVRTRSRWAQRRITGPARWSTSAMLAMALVTALTWGGAQRTAVATSDADIDVGADGDSISVEIGTPPDVIDGDDGSTDGGSEQPPGCIWQVVPANEGGWGVYRTHPDTGVRQIAVQLFCYGAFVAYGWVDVAERTADDIIASAVAEMTRQLPPPVPVTNPARVGTVGVGTRFSVAPLADVVVSAQVGAHHGTVTARASRLRVHTGDGAIIDCSDLGDGMATLAAADPSAGTCGHHYREPSPPARPYRVTVTVVWEITYVTSVGLGTLDALSTSAVIEHPVVEIQTVGAGRAG